VTCLLTTTALAFSNCFCLSRVDPGNEGSARKKVTDVRGVRIGTGTSKKEPEKSRTSSEVESDAMNDDDDEQNKRSKND
jgi:hypothetical protein